MCVSESFSALQRAEIAEIWSFTLVLSTKTSFSALQRAEIAEIKEGGQQWRGLRSVSVLFNEPKLLKLSAGMW